MNVPNSYFYHDNIQKRNAFNRPISSNEKEEFWDDVSQYDSYYLMISSIDLPIKRR